MPPRFRRILHTLVVLFAIGLGTSHAQEYPAKPVRLIVPFAPGGGSDTLARLLSDKLQPRWGQPVVVENRTGAGGNIAAEAVARAAPDGYTLLISSPGPIVINKTLYGNLAFDPDLFEPVGVVATNYGVLVTHPKTVVTTVAQLIELAKSRPGRLDYSSAGTGTTPHLAGELFKSLARVSVTHIPYRGAGPGFAALLSGEVDMMFVDVFIALPHIRAGKIRALALGGGRRNPLLPGVPPLSETLPGFDYQVWQGLVAPPGTPASVTQRIAAAVAEAVRDGEVVRRLEAIGLEAVGGTPAEMAALMRLDRERWGRIIRATGARAD